MSVWVPNFTPSTGPLADVPNARSRREVCYAWCYALGLGVEVAGQRSSDRLFVGGQFAFLM
jgi:hypothetical protein